MKATGYIRIETEDNKILNQPTTVKLDKSLRYITAVVDGEKHKYVIPARQYFTNPIVYGIHDPLPANEDLIHSYYGESNVVKTTIREKPTNITRRLLIVEIK